MSTDQIGNRHLFQRLAGGGYGLSLIDDGVLVEVRHLRRERHQMFGEVNVICEWAVARTFQDTKSISCADLNLSSQSAREARGKYCAVRAKSRPEDFDWAGVIDDACRRVIEAERTSSGAIVLDDAPDGLEQDFQVHGLSIPADAASGLIADGGGLKSLLLLYVLGTRAQSGAHVLYLDWEWTAARHRARKFRLFGPERIDGLFYWKCQAPLTVELDRIRRFVDEHRVDLVGVDSVALAADGKLTDDDTARYFQRALGELPPSICAAHIPKSQFGQDPKVDVRPFGSAFFHNYLRASWVLKKQTGATDDDVVVIGAFPSKQNDGPRAKPVGFEFTFTPERIHIRGVDLATVDGLSDSVPIRLRMISALRRGAMSLEALTEELNAKKNSIEQVIARDRGKTFVRLPMSSGTATYVGLAAGTH